MPKRTKAVDTYPIISTAGIITPKPEGIIGLLKSYTDNDLAQYTVQKGQKLNHFEKMQIMNKIEIIKPQKFPTKLLMAPELNKFRFKKFEEEYFEGLYYKSLKSAPLGVAAKTHSKPHNVTNISQTFGKDTKSKYSLYDVILPRRKPIDVKREEIIDHEKYPLSYKNRYPSEKNFRNYDKASYDPNTTFGEKINADPSGVYIKNIMKEYNPTFQGIIQNGMSERNHPDLGKIKDLQNADLNPDTIYGKPYNWDRYYGQYVIQNEPLNPELIEFYDALKYLEERRRNLKKLPYDWFREVEGSLEKADKNKTEYINFKTFFEVLKAHQCRKLDQNKYKLAAKFLNLIQPETGFVNYLGLFRLLQIRIPLPKYTNILKEKNILKGTKGLSSTYQALALDIEKKDETYSKIEPEKQKRYSNKTVNAASNMKQLLSPSVPTQFGLNVIDYLRPRSQDEIKIIFKKRLADISEDSFKQILTNAEHLKKSENGKISVEAFKNAIEMFFENKCK